MTNLQSQKYLQEITGWRFDNLRDLSEDTWVAIATTTHLQARGESEQTFVVIARGFDHFKFGLHEIPELTKWGKEQTEERTTLYAAAVGVLDALNRFYAEHTGPAPELSAAVDALAMQVNIAREKHDHRYEGLRGPLASVIPLVQALIEGHDRAETGVLAEALERAGPFFPPVSLREERL